jgi:hypothetical protein
MTQAGFLGRVERLLRSADQSPGLEKQGVIEVECRFDGIAGDCHAGLTRLSDSRTLQLYRRGTAIRNVRQVTLVSAEELAEIASLIGIPEVRPEWLGANLMITGIPELTLLPPSTRLQFPSGCTLVVDMENAPCRQVAEVIAREHPAEALRFVHAARHKRGVTAWVEREGMIGQGDSIALWLPPQRIYVHDRPHRVRPGRHDAGETDEKRARGSG